MFFFPITLPLVALLVIYVLGCFLIEMEFFGWATLALIATVIGVQFLHVFDIFAFVRDNALTSLIYTAAYLGIGVVWSFVKWFSYLMKFRDKFREAKNEFLRKKHLAEDQPIPEAFRADFSAHLRESFAYKNYDYPGLRDGLKPVAANNKAKITAWMAFWPCSVVSTLLNDPVRRLFKFLFNLFKGLYQQMSDRVFRNDPDLK